MRSRMKTAAIASCLFALPSCGGSASPETVATAVQGFQSQLDIYNNQTTKLRSIAPTAAMPTQGRATYSGTVGVSSNQDFVQPMAIGNVELNADFASSTISGSLGNFVSSTGAVSSLPISLSNGFIAGNQIIADVSGGNPLAPSAGNISGSIQGSFLGPSADAVAGTLVGNNSSSAIYGRFGAER